jgi:hypothetical protein
VHTPAKKVNTLCTRAINICMELPSGLETTHIHSLGEDEHNALYFIQKAISSLQVDVTRTAAATSRVKSKKSSRHACISPLFNVHPACDTLCINQSHSPQNTPFSVTHSENNKTHTSCINTSLTRTLHQIHV